MAAPLRIFRDDRPQIEDGQLYGRTPEEALSDERLHAIDVRVLGVLALIAVPTHPYVYASRAKIAEKALVTERGLLNILDRAEQHGYIERGRDYSRSGAPRYIKLLKEFREKFVLNNDPLPKRKSACNRNGGSGCNRNGHSGCNRNGGSGPTIREIREEKRREPPPQPRGAASSPVKKTESGGGAIPVQEIAALSRIADRCPPEGPSPETMAARKRLRELEAADRLGDYYSMVPDRWPGEPRPEMKPAAGSSGKTSPQPVGASIADCSDDVRDTDPHWSGRGSNPQPPHCERLGEESIASPRDGKAKISQLGFWNDEKRRIPYAALPLNPQPAPNHNPDFSRDEPQNPGPGESP